MLWYERTFLWAWVSNVGIISTPKSQTAAPTFYCFQITIWFLSLSPTCWRKKVYHHLKMHLSHNFFVSSNLWNVKRCLRTMPISAFIYANQGKKKNWNCPSSPFNDDNYSNTRDWAAGRHCSVMIATPYNNILTKNRTKIDGHSGSFWCYTQIIVTKPKAAVPSELQFFTFTKEKYRGKNLGDFFISFWGKSNNPFVCAVQ